MCVYKVSNPKIYRSYLTSPCEKVVAGACGRSFKKQPKTVNGFF